MHTHVRTQTHTHKHTHICVRAHAHTHTHTHTHKTHTHTHKKSSSLLITKHHLDSSKLTCIAIHVKNNQRKKSTEVFAWATTNYWNILTTDQHYNVMYHSLGLWDPFFAIWLHAKLYLAHVTGKLQAIEVAMVVRRTTFWCNITVLCTAKRSQVRVYQHLHHYQQSLKTKALY